MCKVVTEWWCGEAPSCGEAEGCDDVVTGFTTW